MFCKIFCWFNTQSTPHPTLRGNSDTIQSLYNAIFGVHRNGLCYKGTILQRNCRKMTIKWSFSYNSFVKFHRLKKPKPQHDHTQICVIMRCVIKGLYSKCIIHKWTSLPSVTWKDSRNKSSNLTSARASWKKQQYDTVVIQVCLFSPEKLGVKILIFSYLEAW